MKKAFRFLARYGYAAASCLYLFSVGAVSARHRLLIYHICKHFGYRFPGLVEPVIPRVELSAIVDRNASIEFREPNQDDGNISLSEILVINSLIAVHQPKALFEIGTFDGRTTLNMAANSAPDALVYTLDLPKAAIDATKLELSVSDRPYIDKDRPGSRFAETELAKKIVQLAGDSATFDFTPFFDRVDFVFIDGSHSYDYVWNDSRVAFKLLRGGKGIILWHDYEKWHSVTKALNELYGSQMAQDLKWIDGTSFVILKRE